MIIKQRSWKKNTRESHVDMSQGSFKKNLNYLYNIQRIFLYLRLLIYERISTKINELEIICIMEFISIVETSLADLQDGVSDIFVLNDCLSVCLKGN